MQWKQLMWKARPQEAAGGLTELCSLTCWLSRGMFTSVLFTATEPWRQPRCATKGEVGLHTDQISFKRWNIRQPVKIILVSIFLKRELLR